MLLADTGMLSCPAAFLTQPACAGDPETPREARRSRLDGVQGRLRRPAQIRCGMRHVMQSFNKHPSPSWLKATTRQWLM